MFLSKKCRDDVSELRSGNTDAFPVRRETGLDACPKPARPEDLGQQGLGDRAIVEILLDDGLAARAEGEPPPARERAGPESDRGAGGEEEAEALGGRRGQGVCEGEDLPGAPGGAPGGIADP